MRRHRKVKAKPRFYALMTVLLIVVIVVVVLILTNSKAGVIETGAIDWSSVENMVVVRDETSVSIEKYDRVIYKAPEGADILEGDAVASVFKWGYTDERMQSLIAVQKEILNEQNALLESITNPELASLNAQIAQKLVNVRDAVMYRSGSDALTLENDLKELLNERKTMLKELVQPNEKLNQLYAEESLQLSQLNEWKADVTAKGSGRISFYFDGYEQVMNASKLDMLNSALIASVFKSAAGTGSKDAAQTLLYRVVNSGRWYTAFLTNASSPQRLVGGEQYTVVFDGYPNDPVTATALEPAISDDKAVNVLEFTSDIGEFIGIRSVSATIRLNAQGLKVPNKAIVMQNGMPGVNLVMDGGTKRMEVVVLASDAENAIIRPRNAADVLTAGMRFERG